MAPGTKRQAFQVFCSYLQHPTGLRWHSYVSHFFIGICTYLPMVVTSAVLTVVSHEVYAEVPRTKIREENCVP